jgi:hypothetical protein
MWDLWWKSGTGADFLRIFWFPLPIIIPSPAPSSSSLSSSGVGAMGALIAHGPSGLNFTPPQEMKKKKLKKSHVL